MGEEKSTTFQMHVSGGGDASCPLIPDSRAQRIGLAKRPACDLQQHASSYKGSLHIHIPGATKLVRGKENTPFTGLISYNSNACPWMCFESGRWEPVDVSIRASKDHGYWHMISSDQGGVHTQGVSGCLTGGARDAWHCMQSMLPRIKSMNEPPAFDSIGDQVQNMAAVMIRRQHAVGFG